MPLACIPFLFYLYVENYSWLPCNSCRRMPPDIREAEFDRDLMMVFTEHDQYILITLIFKPGVDIRNN